MNGGACSACSAESKTGCGWRSEGNAHTPWPTRTDRTTHDKTSAVHFLRFELPAGLCGALGEGATMRFGIEHDEYRHDCVLSQESRAALVADID